MDTSLLYTSFQLAIDIRKRIESLDDLDQVGVTMPLNPDILYSIQTDLTQLHYYIDTLLTSLKGDYSDNAQEYREGLLVTKNLTKVVGQTLRKIDELKTSLDSAQLCKAEEAFISLSDMDLLVNLLARQVYKSRCLNGSATDSSTP